MANGSRRALLGLVGSTVAVILIAWTGRAHLASLLDKSASSLMKHVVIDKVFVPPRPLTHPSSSSLKTCRPACTPRATQ